MDTSKTRMLLTRREAADALGVSVDTLVRLLDAGELRAVRVGRSVRVPTSEVESFVDRRLTPSSDAAAHDAFES
jgi:excisionase family DNA binding protein